MKKDQITRWVIALGVLVSVGCFSVRADEALKLSGIMAGDKPTAIVNDQIVAVGDMIEGVQILEIGADYIVCQGGQGPFELRLNESSAPVIKPKNAPVQPPSASPQKTSADSSGNPQGDISSQARRHLDRSVDYLKEADALLKSPLAFERLYTKAAQFCDEAEREAQQAFRMVKDDAVRLNVKNHIDRVRQVKNVILKQKADFSTHIRSLIAARQIKTGMTSKDVTSSWGPPLIQKREGQVDKWVYQDDNGYQKELIFKDGVLVAY